MQVNPATASLYIVHPFRGQGVANMFSTHPPLAERIRRLREYDAGAGHPLRLGPLARTSRRRRRRSVSVAPTQDALYAGLDLELSWSERELPERERTKHVHRLHPYLGKFIPQLVEVLLERYVRAGRARARPVRRLGHDARAGARVRATTRPASTSPRSTAC